MIDIEKILKSKENVNIEVKLAEGGIPKSLWETYSSFANTNGGVVLLGVTEDKKTKALLPVGVSNPEQLKSDLWSTLNNQEKISTNILTERQLYTVEHDFGNGIVTLIVLEVPKADRHMKPVYVGKDFFKGTYRRNGEGDYLCKREEVLAMLRDQSEESMDYRIVENLKISDLCADSVKRYRMRFSNTKPEHVWNNLSDEDFLIKIGAAKVDGNGVVRPTLGGLLFFGEFLTIMGEMPNFFLDYRERLRDETRWTDRVCSGDGDWSGNVFDFYYKIIDRLTADVKVPFELVGIERNDDTPVHQALREALANALIHADYYGRQGIVIEKCFREITISNPGTFRIKIDDAIAGGISDARNRAIFNMFALIQVGERSGMGLCNLYHIFKKNGFATPEIIEKSEPDRIVLRLELQNEDENVGVNDTINEPINEPISEPINEPIKISDSRKIILHAISGNLNITQAELVKETGLTLATVKRGLIELKEKGYIERVGSRKSGTWKILK